MEKEFVELRIYHRNNYLNEYVSESMFVSYDDYQRDLKGFNIEVVLSYGWNLYDEDEDEGLEDWEKTDTVIPVEVRFHSELDMLTHDFKDAYEFEEGYLFDTIVRDFFPTDRDRLVDYNKYVIGFENVERYEVFVAPDQFKKFEDVAKELGITVRYIDKWRD